MKFILDDQGLKKGINELEQILHFAQYADLVVSAVKRDKRGFGVRRTGNVIDITYSDRHLFFTALAYSLTEGAGDIEQSFDFADFGIMLDMARNGVANLKALKRFTAVIACLGYNYVQLYLEDCYQVDNEPYFGYMRGAYSKSEIKEYVAYCACFGIECVPAIQTLGHYNQLLRQEAYKDIRDINDILLIGEDKTNQLLENIFATVRECYTTDKIHIGMDEAHLVGLGKFLDKHGYVPREQIFERHLKHVLELCKKYGFCAEMWADMFFRLAFDGNYYERGKQFTQEQIAAVPRDVVLSYWDYYHTDKKDFDSLLDMHYQLTRKVKFAGGAWRWFGFAPLNHFTESSMFPAVDSCKGKGITDFLLTMWADGGAECSYNEVLPSIISVSLKASAVGFDTGMADRLCELLTGYTYQEFNLLDSANMVFEKPFVAGTYNPCKYMFYDDALISLFYHNIKPNAAEYFVRHQKALAPLKDRQSEYSYLFNKHYLLCRSLELKSVLGRRIYQAYKAHDTEKMQDIADNVIPDTVSRIREFYAALRQMWFKDYKSVGFEVQDLRIGGLMLRLENIAYVLRRYCLGEIDCIEELEGKKLQFFKNHVDNDELNNTSFFNRYTEIITNSLV